jgi:hypothetical protein
MEKKRRSKSRLNRCKFPVSGTVKDVDGILWDVRRVRPTKHGFDLCFGTPHYTYRADQRNSSQLIMTKELRSFWRAKRNKGRRVLFDLPASTCTLRRVRRVLNRNQRDDVRQFWTERIEDLASLPTRDFAAKHGVEADVAFDWRIRLVRRRMRAAGWWRTPETLNLLLSATPLGGAGRELGVAISEVQQLRLWANRDSR